VGSRERAEQSTRWVDRRTIRYRSRQPADDGLRARLRELAAERRRFGYRRRQEGLVRNRKRTQRLYHQEGLTVRRRRGRKRATGAALHAPVSLASPPRGWRRIGTIGPAVAVRFLRQHGICVAGPDDRGAIEKGLTTIINR